MINFTVDNRHIYIHMRRSNDEKLIVYKILTMTAGAHVYCQCHECDVVLTFS